MDKYKLPARILSNRIRGVLKKKLTGKQLFDYIQGLDLTNPESAFCSVAGTDAIGRVQCESCPISEGLPAGCMRFIQPALDHALGSRVRQAKMQLELLAQELDRRAGEGTGPSST